MCFASFIIALCFFATVELTAAQNTSPTTSSPTTLSPVASGGASELSFSAAVKNRGFLCETLWKNASATNDPLQCVTNVNHLLYTWFLTAERLGPALAGLLCILTAAVTVIVWPIFVVCRYCGDRCGGTKRRPGQGCCDTSPSKWDDKPDAVVNGQYSRCAVNCNRAWVLITVVLAIAALATAVAGGALVIKLYNAAYDNARGVLTWAGNKTDFVQRVLTIEDVDGVFNPPPPLTNATFEGLRSNITQIGDMMREYKERYDPYVLNVGWATIVLAALPCAGIVVTAVFAARHVRRPTATLVNSFFHVGAIFVYGVFGGILLISSILFLDVAGERYRFLTRKPGLVSWYVVPFLDSKGFFTTINEQVNAAEYQASIAGCTAMTQLASVTRTNYSASNKTQIFSWNVSDPASQCQTIDGLIGGVSAMRLLWNSPVYCDAVNGSMQRTACDLFLCARTCNVSLFAMMSVGSLFSLDRHFHANQNAAPSPTTTAEKSDVNLPPNYEAPTNRAVPPPGDRSITMPTSATISPQVDAMLQLNLPPDLYAALGNTSDFFLMQQSVTTAFRKGLRRVVAQLRYGQAAFSAFRYGLQPLMNFTLGCDELFRELSVIEDLAEALLVTGVGLCVLSVVFVADLFVMFRGTKLFFDVDDVAPDVDATEPVVAGNDDKTVAAAGGGLTAAGVGAQQSVTAQPGAENKDDIQIVDCDSPREGQSTHSS